MNSKLHSFEIMLCNILNVFTATFYVMHASMQNKELTFLGGGYINKIKLKTYEHKFLEICFLYSCKKKDTILKISFTNVMWCNHQVKINIKMLLFST